jgi:lysophospholipase L1-like esterase
MLPWINEKCHRSSLSAPLRAAKRVAQNNQYAGNILYNSFACTGATLNQGKKLDGNARDGGILTGQTSSGMPSQIQQVNTRYGSRRIDALSISIGGNDLSYADILKDCSDNDCVKWDSPTRKMFNWDAPQLQNSLRELITAVQGDEYGNGRSLAGNARYVYLTAYPDLFNDSYGVTCRNTGGVFVNGFTPAENEVMRGYLGQLNNFLALTVAEANARPTVGHKPVWKLIAAPNFTRNGYCAQTNRYINTTEMSLWYQKDVFGTMHPNAAGHQVWSNQLYNALSWIATSN